jgi:hypothetical protein
VSQGSITTQTIRPGAIDLTLAAFGQPVRTTALIFGADGSFAPDPSVVQNPSSTTQAQTLAEAMAIANFAAVGAGTSQMAANYTIKTLNIVPAGQGTPVATPLTMFKAVFGYWGYTQVTTTTRIPANRSLDPRLFVTRQGASDPLSDTVNLKVYVNIPPDGSKPSISGDQIDTIRLPDKNGKLGKQIEIESKWAFSSAQ